MTAQLKYFYELLTVLLEYIALYSHFLQVSINQMEILTLKQLGLACRCSPVPVSEILLFQILMREFSPCISEISYFQKRMRVVDQKHNYMYQLEWP